MFILFTKNLYVIIFTFQAAIHHLKFYTILVALQFPGDKPSSNGEDPASQPPIDQGETRRVQHQQPRMTIGDNYQNPRASPVRLADANDDGHVKMDNKLIDLNMKPNRMHGQASNKEVSMFSLFGTST